MTRIQAPESVGHVTDLKISAQLGLSSTWIPDHMHNNCPLPIEIFPIEGVISFKKCSDFVSTTIMS